MRGLEAHWAVAPQFSPSQPCVCCYLPYTHNSFMYFCPQSHNSSCAHLWCAHGRIIHRCILKVVTSFNFICCAVPKFNCTLFNYHRLTARKWPCGLLGPNGVGPRGSYPQAQEQQNISKNVLKSKLVSRGVRLLVEEDNFSVQTHDAMKKKKSTAALFLLLKNWKSCE